ncbi:MAG: PAS domain-containing protein [Deltaproteobacteria bacterium]|nr:PAS domain-containing protein [Deltaproteobacteria bacterium]
MSQDLQITPPKTHGPKNAEQANHRLMALQAKALDATSNPIFITDPDGTILWANQAAQTNYGYRLDELVGQNPRILASGEHDQPFYRDLWETILAEKIWRGTIINRTKTGNLCHEEMTITPILGDKGSIESFIAIKQDITKRKRRDDALRLAIDGTAAKTGEAFFRASVRFLSRVSNVRCALIEEIINEAGTRARPLAVWLDDSFLPMGDHPIAGTPSETIVREARGLTCIDDLSEHFPATRELFPFKPQGYQGLPILNEEGLVIGHLAILDDAPLREDLDRDAILQLFAARAGAELLRHGAETRLRTAKEKAVTANEAKSQFIANVSHELRTPLNGILGYAQILARDESLTSPQREATNVIKRSGEHLLGLINDILDLSKVEADQTDLVPTAFRLDTFLADIIQAFAPRAKEKTIRLIQDIEGAAGAIVEADEKRLRQVLFNLVGNAIKFTDAGEVRLAIHRRGSHTSFVIADTGVGIPADELERVFDPFHQAGSRERRVKGTGLGLAISRKLVRLMGSDLHVESTPTVGSQFFFSLHLPTPLRPPKRKDLASQNDAPRMHREVETALSTLELEALQNICLQGDVLALRDRVATFRGRGATQDRFVDQILDLAANFRMKAIREVLREHLHRHTRGDTS